MAVSRVHLSADAHLVILEHALSNEKEEIMGLLIGEHSFVDRMKICVISAVMVLRRSDKQPDRVEISPEQLSDASSHAERLAEDLDRPMRVVGWYHSHPHITVWPSHVDVQTQAMYQMLDEGFIGLIFSVFNQDKEQMNRMQLTCFQSINQSPEGEPPQHMRIEIPLYVIPCEGLSQPNVQSLAQLPQILSQEEEEAYEKTRLSPDLDVITQIHNGSVFVKRMGRIMQVMTGPLLQTLENRLKNNEDRVRDLAKQKEELLQELASVEAT